ncbi:MAG: hypothetical protein WCP20_19605 [Desulfuromonadales bacterium]
MQKILVAVLLISGMMTGCAQNHFNIPADNFAEKVKVLGIIPIIVDTDSDIRHPQKEQLLQIVTDMNRAYEQQFVRKVKRTGNFYTVALMEGDSQKIFDHLLFRREKRDDATIQYNKYFFKNVELRDYIQKNNLDAVMLIVVSGLTKTDKVYSGSMFSSLTSDFNFLTMTAQILDPNGAILWEYPNFRQRILTYNPMINLQYPDFSEAEANLSSRPNLKFKTLEGIQRSFDQKRKDLLQRETQETEIYGKQFDEMLDLLKYDPDADRKASVPARPPTQQPLPAEPVAAPGRIKPAMAPEVVPAVELYKPAIQPVETPKPPVVEAPKPPVIEAPKPPVVEVPKPPESVIVPAAGSTQ